MSDHLKMICVCFIFLKDKTGLFDSGDIHFRLKFTISNRKLLEIYENILDVYSYVTHTK